MRPLKIVHISDTHETHRGLSLPEGDILVHSGDFTKNGDIKSVIEFNSWLGTLPYKDKIVIAGNHDRLFEESPGIAQGLITNGVYLQDTSVIIQGVKFYGSPWQPAFYNWAFNIPRDDERLFQTWEKIPDDTGVLITHGPPMGIHDRAISHNGDISVGCSFLKGKLDDLKLLRMHLFGHIHEAYGSTVLNGVLYSNGASCNRKDRSVNPPRVIYIDDYKVEVLPSGTLKAA